MLESIPDEGVDPDVWMAAKLRAAAMRDPGESATWDQPVRDLQRDVLRARLATGRASSEDVIRFAQIAVDHRVEDPSGAGLAEAEQAIVDALEQSPGDVSLLEHQLLIRQLTGDPRVHDSLRELERVRPDSPLLQAFVEQPTDRQVLEETQARLARLFQDAVQSDPSTRAAALTDLGAEVARFPGEVQRRTAYALALMIAGRHDEAVEQASVGARLAGDDHAMHFNLGQVFLGAGKVKRARKHLLLARQYAVDDEERADADKLLARLDG